MPIPGFHCVTMSKKLILRIDRLIVPTSENKRSRPKIIELAITELEKKWNVK